MSQASEEIVRQYNEALLNRYARTEPVYLNVKVYGAKGDGVTDDTSAFTQAIAAAAASDSRIIYVPGGEYRISSTLQISARGIRFVGARHGRPSENGGSRLNFTGTGALFQLGTDNGLSYDTAAYDGIQGFSLEHISLKYTGSSTTALENGMGVYGTGTYGVRDWRGGDIYCQNVTIENFHYGIWGVQSDVNTLNDMTILYCCYALYFTARSDQLSVNRLYTLSNDCAVKLNKIGQARFNNCQFVGDGGSTVAPVEINNGGFALGSNGIVFNDCWFEHFQGINQLNSFVKIGVGDTGAASKCVVFRNPFIITNPIGTLHVKYFVTIENADEIYIFYPSGTAKNNIEKTVEFVGSTSPNVYVEMTSGEIDNKFFINNGTGTPNISGRGHSSGGVHNISRNGRFYNYNTARNINRDWFLSSESDKRFQVTFPSTGDGNTARLLFDRRFVSGNAAPTTNTWDTGDIVMNTSPTAFKNISHWSCVSGGTSGTWMAHGMGMGNTTSRPSLVAGDKGYQYFDTTLVKIVVWDGAAWVG